MKRRIGTLLALIFVAMSCLATTCVSDDPLEQLGPFDVYVGEEFLVPNPESEEDGIPARIYAPSEDGGESVADGAFPLVVFLPGNGRGYGAYEAYHRHLASHGSVVVGMNYFLPNVAEEGYEYTGRQVLYVIEHVLGEEGGPVSGHIDGSRIATAGHSLGGLAAFFAAVLDPGIGAVMALDPFADSGVTCGANPEYCMSVAPHEKSGYEGKLDNLQAASLVMRAAPDILNPLASTNAEVYWYGLDGQGAHGVPAPGLYYDMGDVGHASWLYSDLSHVERITKRTMVAWLKTHFGGEAMDDYLTGEITQADLDEGLIVAVESR